MKREGDLPVHRRGSLAPVGNANGVVTRDDRGARCTAARCHCAAFALRRVIERKMSIRRTRAASLTSDVRPNSNTTVDVPAARTTLRSYQRSDRVLVVGRALGSRAGGALPPRPSDRTVFLHSYRPIDPHPGSGRSCVAARRAGSRIIVLRLSHVT